MAFIHRKLIIDPLYEVATQICKQYCDMITNPRGFCPSNCFSICDSSFSSSCKIPLPDVILLSAPPPPPPPPENFKSPEDSSHHHMEFSTGLVISILSTITVFSLLFCFVLYKCYRVYRSRRLTRESETGREDTHQEFVDEDHGFVMDHPIWYIRTVGLQPSVISAITICKYKKGEGLVEGTECSVCLNEFEEDETLRLLPKCNHAFHIPCIDTWLRSHTNCPLCRAGIVSMPAVLPVPDQRILDNSNVLEDSQVGVLGNNSENRGENEGVDSELRDCLIGQPRSQSERRNGIEKEDFGNLDQLEVNEVVQQMRRSVSLDFSCGEMAKGSDLNMGFVAVAEKRVDVNLNLGSSSSGRSKEHFSMRRSFSYSGKVLFSRHNNSQSRS